jgi:hypothetical protein
MGKRDGERERLLRIISTCLAVERRSSDPFAVQVKDVLETLRQYLPHWTVFEDFTLDAEALNRVASIVQLQGKWIKERSTSLYIDPLLIELKVKMMTREQLVTVFAHSWHPIVEMEGLTRKRVDDAVHYWNQLLSLEEKRLRLPTPSNTLGSTTIEELLKLRILSEESFNTLLERFWEELKGKTGVDDGVFYWDFVLAPTFEETIYRAYLTSFLVTYGYAAMEVDPLEEDVLIPYAEPRATGLKELTVSVPVAINYELWKRMMKGERK